MARRNSEYTLVDLSRYETPDWVVDAVLPFLGRGTLRIWEPACGSGQMARRLHETHAIVASDISLPTHAGTDPGESLGIWDIFEGDFFDPTVCEVANGGDAIVTNPPYGRVAPKFVRRAIELMRPNAGLVAMLLPISWDEAPGRKDLFGNCEIFSKRIVLTRRIVFIKRDGKEAPSEHHAWFIWDWLHVGPATNHYVHTDDD
jgi:hypothetical protein